MTLKDVLMFAALVSLAACGSASAEGAAPDTQAQAAPEAEVLVTGPGVTVTDHDIRVELEILPAEQRQKILSDEKQFRSLVNEIYFRRRMTLLAEEFGYTEEDIVKAQLRRNEEQLFMDLVPRRHLSSLELPDFSADARADYDANPEFYTPEEQIRVAHILLRAPSEEERAQRRPEAEALLARVNDGESFAQLAREHGEDGTKLLGGDLGFFGPGRMVPEFEEAAFALENVGDVELVETRHGLHLILLMDREGTEPTPFAEVESWIKNKLRREYQEREMTAWLRSVASPKEAGVNAPAIEGMFQSLAEEIEDKTTSQEPSAETPAVQR